MTYTHRLPTGELSVRINPASGATVNASLADIERVANLIEAWDVEAETRRNEAQATKEQANTAPDVSQVDIVVGEQAVAILERLRDLLGVPSLGAVEAEVERMRGPDVLTGWPSEPLPGLWTYCPADDDGLPMDPVVGRWQLAVMGDKLFFIDHTGVTWFRSDFVVGQRFERVKEGSWVSLTSP